MNGSHLPTMENSWIMIYPSQKASWACVAGGVAAPLMIGVGLVLCWQAVMQALPVPPVLLFPMGVSLSALGLFVLWGLLSTSYEITPAALVIRFGPLRRTIPMSEIVEVAPKQNMLDLEAGWGFAWSLDRIHVRYRGKNGRFAFPVKISPSNKIGFLRELVSVLPDLEVYEDRVLRVRELLRGGRR